MGFGGPKDRLSKRKKSPPETVTRLLLLYGLRLAALHAVFLIMKPFSVLQNSKFYLGEEETFFIAFYLRLSTFKSNNVSKRWSSGGHFLHRCKGCRNPVHYQSIFVRRPRPRTHLCNTLQNTCLASHRVRSPRTFYQL
jgi:hypothetical protein